MKVNIYDPENVQKGRMMLLNIAEDLKEDCKMTVSPAQQEKDKAKIGDKKETKPVSIEEIEQKAKLNREKKDDLDTLT